jgi:uncharacterized FAD-dependent dehydrogenase
MQTKQYKHIFIGIGPANLFAALYLVKQGETDILMIDKGKPLKERNKKDLLHGTMGAGGFSDAKYVFSEIPDLNIIKFLGINSVRENYSFIQKMINEFHPTNDIDITYPDKTLESLSESKGWGDLSIAQSLTWHLGSELGKEVGYQIEQYLINSSVDILFETEFLEFSKKTIQTSNGDYGYKHLYLALGRTGSKKILSLLNDRNITPIKNYLDLGIRFETPYQDKIKEISEKQYDFKFKHKNARTFCVCNLNSHVAKEFKDKNFISWNGEGYGSNSPENKKNNLTNFGILITKRFDDVNEEIQKARENIQVITNNTFDNSRDISNENLVTLEGFESPIKEELIQFIEKIEPILGFKNNWIGYYPEIKEGSGKIEGNKNWTINGIPNVYFLGDSTPILHDGGTRGIVPAAVSGIDCIKKVLKDNNE